MSRSVAEIAGEVAGAFNELGHIACGHSFDEVRRARGNERLKEMMEQSARLCLDFIQSVQQGPNPAPFPRPEEAKAALSQFQALLSHLDLNDAKGLDELRACARQVFEFLGIPLPE
jgi:hypothetical protein